MKLVVHVMESKGTYGVTMECPSCTAETKEDTKEKYVLDYQNVVMNTKNYHLVILDSTK